jgi:transcriptional regulator with GAF, ATPase, and Fis domain
MDPSPPTPPGAAAETANSTGRDRDESDYLLCIDGERSWRAAIPANGELIIGRAPDVGLRLEDDLVSRNHAQVLAVPDGLRITDLGSRHGTSVNGKRLAAPRLLASGDVVAIGRTVLIVHRPTRMAGVRAMVDVRVLHGRIEEEIERALRYHRELGLAVIRGTKALDRARVAGALAGRLRLMDCAAILGDHEVALLLPEVGLDEAQDTIASLIEALGTVAPGLAAGLAASPSDGIDADSLLSSATASAEAAAPGSVALVRNAIRRLELGGHDIVLAEPAMIQLYDLAKRLARSGMPILIRGETGVGKELAAAAVHAYSERTGPLISINCAAIPESLAESELFGHEKGAFSGAVAAKPGRLELASGGTVFLDEVGELPLPVQAKLLRVLETNELTRIGDVKVRTTDLRVVAATNRDLETDIEAGKFRRDLFFRLAAGQLLLPPLRDRPRDLTYLAGKMLDEACAQLHRRPLALSVAATQALLLHRWPGNVRELKHAMSYAATAVPDTGVEIDVWHLPPSVAATVRVAREAATPMASSAASIRIPTPAEVESAGGPIRAPGSRTFRPIADEVRELERQRIVEALIETGGIQNQAAALIEMPLRTFVTKLKRYGITSAEWSVAEK